MIYFLEAQTTPPVIKIGFTGGDGHARVDSLRSACPADSDLVAVMPGGRAEERELHRRFSASNVHGEWFSATLDLTDFIAANAQVVDEFAHRFLTKGAALSVRDVMARTSRGRFTVERWLRSGKLKSSRPDWRYIVFEKDLERFLERNRYVPPQRRRLPARRLESLDKARARRDRAALEVRREGSL